MGPWVARLFLCCGGFARAFVFGLLVFCLFLLVARTSELFKFRKTPKVTVMDQAITDDPAGQLSAFRARPCLADGCKTVRSRRARRCFARRPDGYVHSDVHHMARCDLKIHTFPSFERQDSGTKHMIKPSIPMCRSSQTVQYNQCEQQIPLRAGPHRPKP